MKTKLDYITKQLRRTHNKKYENYVVTGIWHRLNDPTLKFVTQQYVMRPDGRALTDMYFPQLQVHIEVDEGLWPTPCGRQVLQCSLTPRQALDCVGMAPLRNDAPGKGVA